VVDEGSALPLLHTDFSLLPKVGSKKALCLAKLKRNPMWNPQNILGEVLFAYEIQKSITTGKVGG